MRFLAVADSDSYIKWGAAMLDRSPEEWERRLVVIKTPALPNERQIDAALAGSSFASVEVPQVDLGALSALVKEWEPDVVLLSLRGPVVRVLVRAVAKAAKVRPVILSGMPGISYPETFHALYYRAQVDALVLHSKREIAAFGALAAAKGIEQEFALATLPFLTSDAPASHGGDVVFAAQAKVPKELEERRYLVEQLIRAAREHPERRVVLKLRSLAGEPQTHFEKFPFDTILEDFDDVPENLVVSTESMAEHLDTAAVLATVSSTAAIEALARRIPVLLFDDFGVSKGMINVVFEGSGLFRPATDMSGTEFPHADPAWLEQNYFHAPDEETWADVIRAKVAQRERGPVPLRPQFSGTLGGRLRFAWDQKHALGQYDTSAEGRIAWLMVVPLRTVVRRVYRVRDYFRTRRRAQEVQAEQHLALAQSRHAPFDQADEDDEP